ncbi:Hamartin protein-domain-containing protein [Geopyxis carbonaria]|nr:Hamartin protein-domain-containing protein [Geopyxis carbonaria]
MSVGSLKDLVRTLGAALSTPVPLYPLPDDVLSVIQSFLNRHGEIDEHESQRLHEELLNLHANKVYNHPERLAVFLACFRNLRPAIFGVERLSKWWEILVRPTLDSMGQAKAVVADARAIVLSVLAYEDEDDPTGQKAEASSVFTDKLFEIFLERTRLPASSHGAVREEQKHRFVSANVEAVLLAYGKRRPKAFLEKIDHFVVQKEYRLQILGLLCSYVRLQGPHLYHVLHTELFDHLLQCLENDTSTTVISLALTILIMFMPHLCNSLAEYLPRLFVVYTRVLCWDKFGIVRLDVGSHLDVYSRTSSPLSAKPEESTTFSGWQKLDSSFETAQSTTPDVSDYFSFLYGLYPINFLEFIREPYKFLERVGYRGIDHLDIEEETIRQRSDTYRQRHILHPNFFTLTAQTELKDQSRWMKVEPADVTAQCIGLVNNNVSAVLSDDMESLKPESELPAEFIPTEEIPAESLLSQGDDGPGPGYDPESGYLDPSSNTSRSGYGREVKGLFQRGNTGYMARTPSSRDTRSPDSPTIPATLAPAEEAHLQDMLNLQEQLHASLQDSIKHDGPSPTPPPQTRLPDPPGPPPMYSSSVTASPRLDGYAQSGYVQSLSQTNMPRSPALRPAASDTQGTIAYLQREVMLLKNDLNFERYLKQQHLSHIGHLQRKHIKESTAEAETQNLINTNKTLKAKLEEAKKAYTASRQETLKSKNQAKKWEAELSAKIRTLREEQKAWRQDEEATKKALDVAREETDHLRKLLAESEAEGLRCRQKLQSLSTEMDEVSKLRTFVDHLSNKLTEYEARNEEFEMQRHSEEQAITQAERMKIRLQSREQEIQKMKRGYEAKLQEMDSRMSSMSNPMPSNPGPGFQGMIDNALAVANSRLTSLKKAHNHLLQKYTDLEIKYLELQASQEMDGIGMHHSGSQAPYHHQFQNHYVEMPSDNEASHHNGRSINRHERQQQQQHQQHQHYQHSEDSMSPVSSYPESSAGGSNNGGSRMENMHSYQMHNGGQQSPPQTATTMSSGYMNTKYGNYGQMSPHEQSVQHTDFPFPNQGQGRPQLRHRPSVPDSFMTQTTQATNNSANTHTNQSSASGETESLKTVTSTTSSETRKKEKIKPGSQVRIRGRGGVQNVGKKVKDSDGEGSEVPVKEPKPKKKSRFATGSGLAGIRGFV